MVVSVCFVVGNFESTFKKVCSLFNLIIENDLMTNSLALS